MSLKNIQEQLWAVMLQLQQTGQMANREVVNIALVRFTWIEDQAMKKLNELRSKLSLK